MAAVPNNRLREALQYHARGERAGFVLHLLECHTVAVMVEGEDAYPTHTHTIYS